MTFDRTIARLPFVAAAVVVTVTSFALTAPVEASETTPTVAAVTAPMVVAAYDKPVCRKTNVKGSRIPKKVCKAQAEWDLDDERTPRRFEVNQ